MDEPELLRYQNLLLGKQRELSARKNRLDLTTVTDEPGRDPVDVAATQSGAAVQIRLNETDSKLVRAIADALMRIQQGKYGECEECGRSISIARLEAVPWARHCIECKERQAFQR